MIQLQWSRLDIGAEVRGCGQWRPGVSDGRRLRGGRVARVSAALCALGGVVALLLLSAGSAGSANRVRTASAQGGVPVAQAAAASPTGRLFDGVAAVGALFNETNGKLGSHFCTASVVHSAAGDLALTAAHCVYGRTGAMAFVPGYTQGQTPYGVWQVTRVYTDSAWDSAQDPDHDVAFLKLADASDGVPIENVTGAETLGMGSPAGELVQVIGYPDDADQPVWCAGTAKGFSATQLEFDCGGYPVGTSGGPFLADVDESTGQGTVIGVIGGYQQGGDTSAVSYAASFGTAVAMLYAQAQAGS
jgi:V8-like Glu-specific endopeptidase